MKTVFFLLSLVLLVSCTTTRYYVVRHTEKAAATGMSSDVPLSPEGQQRAEALREQLKQEGIRHIFSSNYQRTRNTAAPLGEHLGVGTQTYDPRDTLFIGRLKAIKENTLVVGHSNTVDDIVNGLTGRNHLQDLRDEEYGDLFIIKRKGKKYSFEKSRFGK